MSDRINVSIADGVADVRLTRVDKMNALDDAMFAALVETGERLKVEPGLRAVVLSGEGRAFCAGLDMGNFGRMAAGPSDDKKQPRLAAAALARAPMAWPTGRNMPCGSGVKFPCRSSLRSTASPLAADSNWPSARICAS